MLTDTLSSTVPAVAETASTLAVCAAENTLGSAGLKDAHSSLLNWSAEYSVGEYSVGEYSVGEYSVGEYSVGEYSVGEVNVALYSVGEYSVGENRDVNTSAFRSDFQFVGSQAERLYCDVLKRSTGASAPSRFRSSRARFGPASAGAPPISSSYFFSMSLKTTRS